MRFLKEFQTCELNAVALAALQQEIERFCKSGLSLAEWDSLTEVEREILVRARDAVALERTLLLVQALHAESPTDVAALAAHIDGGQSLGRARLSEAVEKAAKSMDSPQFATEHAHERLAAQ